MRLHNFCLLLILFLTGCATPKFVIPPSSLQDRPEEQTVAGSREAPIDGTQLVSPIEADTAVESDRERAAVERLNEAGRSLEKSPKTDIVSQLSGSDRISVSAESMPLKDLLNYVFGDLLKLNFVVASDLPGLEQPVTLNTSSAVSSKALFRLASEILAEKGLAVTLKDNVYFISPSAGRTGANLPIGFGRNDADVPQVAGRILHVVPLKYGANQAIERTLRDLLNIQYFIDSAQSALFLTAEQPVILKALEIVRLFDQPSLRASRVGIVNLTYVGIKEFIDQINNLLDNEGISTAKSGESRSVSFVPIDQLGSVVVFAANTELLDRVDFWAKQIDRPSQGPSQRYFVYQPKFARAVDLGESLAPLIGAGAANLAPISGNSSRDTRSAIGMGEGGINASNVLRRDTSGNAPSAPAVIAVEGEGIRMAVDTRANSLVFYTSGLKYETLLPMIRRLDVSPKQVMLEATIAEVSLTGEFAYGVEFALKGSTWEGGTNFGLPSGGTSLTYLGSLTDQFRLKLSANDSKIQILSRPIILVRDGLQARISVGNDVPTVGASASDPLESTRQITTVLYRKTGLDVGIRPTINAQGTVVLQIDQKTSNSVPGSSGVQGAPIFFERSVLTEVVARSGSTILLAGLISDSGSQSSTNMPFVSRIPLVGSLFRSDERKREKTELVIMITPRVLEDVSMAIDAASEFSKNLGLLQIPP